MDFDEIADMQCWDRDSIIIMLRAFISTRGLEEAMTEYAQAVADEENAV